MLCPKCKKENLIIKSSFRGWQKEYQYNCNSCGHSFWATKLHDEEVLGDQEIKENEKFKKLNKLGFKFYIFPISFILSIILVIYFENNFFIIIGFFSVLYAYFSGFFKDVEIKVKE